MLQDLEAGRPLELDAIVGGVVELAAKVGVPVPATRAVYGTVKLMDEIRGAGAQSGASAKGQAPVANR
jgi:2-dehydropantoate 2-reductase